MSDFRIWGRVESIGHSEFFVIASAVSEDPGEQCAVFTSIATSLARAHEERGRLMLRAGEAVRARGDRVVDVEDD
jgi:hypothetical protein